MSQLTRHACALPLLAVFVLLSIALVAAPVSGTPATVYGTYEDPTFSRIAQQQQCLNTGGEVASDMSAAVHARLTESVRQVKPNGEYFAYLSGSTENAEECPEPTEHLASTRCVWSWETSEDVSGPLAFYQGNFYPRVAGATDGLTGAKPLNGKSEFWGRLNGKQVFPSTALERYMLLTAVESFDGVWTDSGASGGYPYAGVSEGGRGSFYSLCRYRAEDSSSQMPQSTSSSGQPESTAGTTARSLSTGAIVGIAVGCGAGVLLLIALVILAACCCHRRKRRERKAAAAAAARRAERVAALRDRKCATVASAPQSENRSTRSNSSRSLNAVASKSTSSRSAGSASSQHTFSSSAAHDPRGSTRAACAIPALPGVYERPAASAPAVTAAGSRRGVGLQRSAAASKTASNGSVDSSGRPRRRSILEIHDGEPLPIVSVGDMRVSIIRSASGSLSSSASSSAGHP